jgi:chloride channel protein, CIC family
MSVHEREGTRGFLELLAWAALGGLVIGFGVWLFENAIAAVEWLSHRHHATRWSEAHPAARFLAPVLGGLVVGVVMHRVHEPLRRRHGVTEVIEAATLDAEEFPERHVPVSVSMAAVSIGSGASLGPEDPAIEIGGGLGHRLARRLGVSHDRVRSFISAGGAAGIAAAFHAPVGALALAGEVFRVRLRSRTFILVLSAVAGAYLAALLLSPAPPFELPRMEVTHGLSLVAAMGIGVVAGALAAAQIRAMYALRAAAVRLRPVPEWATPALGGVVLGLGALLVPDAIGTGYPALEDILSGESRGTALLVTILVAKLVLLAVSFASGWVGGMFAPSFLAGAALGGALAHVWPALPALTGTPATAYAAVGLAAFLAGMIHAPFAAALLVRAVEGGYALLPLLLVACLTASWVARRLQPHSVYTYDLSPEEQRSPKVD